MAEAIDKQIQDCLPLLGNEEKRSLLHVIRSFLNLRKESPGTISIEQYNKELDEALSRVNEGGYYTQEDVEKEAEKW